MQRPATASLARRDMDDGAIAGTVVGVFFGCALLVFCLYPVIVHYIKRHQRARRHLQLDAELANGGVGPNGEPLPHRISSSDSIKEGGLSRGVDTTDSNVDSQVLNFAHYDPNAPPAAYTPFDGEYMPQDMEDDQPGVLKGTSEDYYRPSIPSEAFGMVPMPDVPEDAANPPIRPLSRTSTLSANVKHMFRRKSARDRTMSSHTSSDDQSSSSAAYQTYGGVQMQRIVTNEEVVAESPTELSPSTSHHGPNNLASTNAAPATTSREASSLSPPPQSPHENRLKYSPSPQHPAPGTVNPMDIMAPSTESELWHQTEHRLFVSSHESSPEAQPMEDSPGHFDDAVSPKSIEQHITPTVNEPEPATSPDTALEQSEQADTVMDDLPSHAHLNSTYVPENGRHPSFPSEHSTPLPGTAFTDASSSQPTPSTQTDTPSPESLNSSDFRHSASPSAGQIPQASPKSHGVFPCDEPGCNQVFDQPHKLK